MNDAPGPAREDATAELPPCNTPACHNVVSLGADNCGRVDATPYVQKALDLALAGPCRNVFFPDGTYRIDGGLRIDHGPENDTWTIRVFSDGGAILQAKAGVTVFRVQGQDPKRLPRRVHFQRLHLIRVGDAAPGTDLSEEVGFHLGARECRLDEVEVSEFRGAGVRLSNAELTNLQCCKLWHNSVNVEDLGDSPACELNGCRLIYALQTGLVWNSRGLTVVAGAIEQSRQQDVCVGLKADAIARFYGVHFEHNSDYTTMLPMVVCGRPGQPGNVQVAFDRCAFFGNASQRLAILFHPGVRACEVVGTWFQNFSNPKAPIDGGAQDYSARSLVVIPH